MFPFYLNNSCITCGCVDFLVGEVVGVTLCREALKKLGLELEEGDQVLVCKECLMELCL